MPRRALTLAWLVALALPSPSARANVSIQGGGGASTGWTDNVLNAPDEPTSKSPPRQGDFLFQLSPRVILSTGEPRFLQRLTYQFTADLFARHSEANSYSNMLDWVANVLASRATTLTFTLQSMQGKVSTFTFNQPSSEANVGVLPQNSNTNFFSQQAIEQLDATPRPLWHVYQALRFNAFVLIDRGRLPDTYQLAGDLGFDRIFRSDALGLLARVDFLDYAQPRDPTTDVPVGFDERQVLTALVARWRRDWSPSWSTEADLGGVVFAAASADPTASTLTAVRPTALAALRWSREYGSADLRYTHDVSANALAGRTFETDAVTLQAGVPIVRAKMVLGATASYQYARQLSLAGDLADLTAHVVLVDVTIGWQPLEYLGVFARYSFFDQFGLPPVNDVPSLLPDLTRNTVMVGVTVLYPPRAGIRIATKQPTRVDRSDQPEFPEVHAAEPPR